MRHPPPRPRADTSVVVRHETPADRPCVAELVAAAFGQQAEARLIASLRPVANVLSLVATVADQVAGHVMLSPITARARAAQTPACGLAPLAVAPAMQRRGIGARLVEAGLTMLGDRGVGLVVVFGHREYYPRFGFAPAASLGLACKWGGEDGTFQALELIPDAARAYRGVVDYHPAFDAFC
jgi:putative acetyltransferase